MESGDEASGSGNISTNLCHRLMKGICAKCFDTWQFYNQEIYYRFV